MKSSLFLGFLLLTAGLTSCDKKGPSPASSSPQPALSLGDQSAAQSIASSAYKHTEKILSFGHRQPESVGLTRSKRYVIEQLKQAGWISIEQKFTAKTPKGPMTFSNIIARYSPDGNNTVWSRPPKAVIGAHIDSKILPNFLGADDAASCVATNIALAQYFQTKHPEVARELELVFFDGEEAVGENMVYGKDGLYGSMYYSRTVQKAVAQQSVPYKQKPKFGIVLDMIGHKNLDIKIPADTPRRLKKSYDQARKKLKLEKHFSHSNGSFLDDHVPMNEIARIPTIDLIGDFSSNKWWHTSGDNLDLISPKSLEMSIHLTLEILADQISH
ncbi:M28 family peptidase [Rubritalea spongiae]|uniref:M28 family peptidase n=1 Tax=Rubritalea spongiae TaxID=430797 RepID=A0ABW5E7X8_9BACT